jgi:hypothetical protein
MRGTARLSVEFHVHSGLIHWGIAKLKLTLAIMKLSGYDTPAKPIITVTSIASLAVACVGGITTAEFHNRHTR